MLPDHFILYRLFSHNNELLYIGITESPHEPVINKFKNTPWADEIARVEKRMYESRSRLRSMRRHAIRNERPRYNVRQRPKNSS